MTVRPLTAAEIEALRADIADSSEGMRADLARREAARRDDRRPIMEQTCLRRDKAI